MCAHLASSELIDFIDSSGYDNNLFHKGDPL